MYTARMLLYWAVPWVRCMQEDLQHLLYGNEDGSTCYCLVNCAGLRLQEATDALDGFGKLYLSQTMASGVIPQIMAIFGTCGGGMAVSAGMADFTFMEDTSAKLFVNSPNALEGNYKAKCDTSSAKFQAEESGLVSSQVMKHLYYHRSVHWYLSCLLTMKKICLKLTAQTI